MVDESELPTGAEGSGDTFAQLDESKARAMLDGLPDADVDPIVVALQAAGEEYKSHANQRRYVVDVLKGLGKVATAAKDFLV